MNNNHLKKIVSTKQRDLLNMVDLALSTNDKKWFMELTEKMKQV
ncbi:IDEAL domain-containing protein [Cytobacillus kochii]|nr:IDEAL domain-containing protein [Cytobacillus kochii]